MKNGIIIIGIALVSTVLLMVVGLTHHKTRGYVLTQLSPKSHCTIVHSAVGQKIYSQEERFNADRRHFVTSVAQKDFVTAKEIFRQHTSHLFSPPMSQLLESHELDAFLDWHEAEVKRGMDTVKAASEVLYFYSGGKHGKPRHTDKDIQAQ